MAINSLARDSILNTVKYSNMLAGNAAYDPSSDFLISEQILTSSAASVTFSSIPQTYKHLQIRVIGRTDTTGVDVRMQVNGLTTSIYPKHQLYGTGTSALSAGATSGTFHYIQEAVAGSTATAGVFGAAVIDILDYTSTTKNKTIRSLSGAHAVATSIRLTSGAVLDLGAITSVLVYTNATNFVAGTRISLYGSLG